MSTFVTVKANVRQVITDFFSIACIFRNHTSSWTICNYLSHVCFHHEESRHQMKLEFLPLLYKVLKNLRSKNHGQATNDSATITTTVECIDFDLVNYIYWPYIVYYWWSTKSEHTTHKIIFICLICLQYTKYFFAKHAWVQFHLIQYISKQTRWWIPLCQRTKQMGTI